jgi:hypothetical protein
MTSIKNERLTSTKQGAELIIEALQYYPVFFEDPDWQNIDH